MKLKLITRIIQVAMALLMTSFTLNGAFISIAKAESVSSEAQNQRTTFSPTSHPGSLIGDLEHTQKNPSFKAEDNI